MGRLVSIQVGRFLFFFLKLRFEKKKGCVVGVKRKRVGGGEGGVVWGVGVGEMGEKSEKERERRW